MRAILDIAINDLRLIFQDRGVWINLVVISPTAAAGRAPARPT
jgi:hypothetical protein